MTALTPVTQWLTQTVWLAPCYGLIGSLMTLPWATGTIRRTGPRPAAYINLLMTVLAVLHGGWLFREFWGQDAQYLTFNWLSVADFNLSFVLELSPLSLGAMELVTGMSLIAQVYALGYLEKDWGLARFFAMMGFFEAAMSGLAISDSLLLSYCLLEMLTLSTYLIVGFWYAQPLAVTGARDAFLTKRVGDILLLMGIVALSTFSGSLNFSDLAEWAQAAQLADWQAGLLAIALIAGPTGKCAQFPLHLWLDEAMEGPNPASLMRNSIVVACGAFVLIKLAPVLALSPLGSAIPIALGSMTAIGASLVAIAQIDIKRALSHTTSAYLGLVFIAVGLQQTDVALLLLLTHAIAKTTLFTSIGGVILNTSTQDMTQMGGLWSKMPASTMAFVVGSMGMVALLPLGAFWAMERWLSEPAMPGWSITIVLLVNGLTALNLTRVFGLVFGGATQPKTRRAPEVTWPMAVPIVSSIILTLLVPLMLERWQLLLTRVGALQFPVSETIALIASAAIGATIGISIYSFGAVARPVTLPLPALQDLLSYDFYIDRIYRLTIVWVVGAAARVTAWVDRYVIDGLVNLVGVATLFGGEGLKYSTSGRSQGYVLVVLISVSTMVVLAGWSLAQLWF
jgi:NAD(P)H-quinone oxidoreductase subunit 5